VSKPQDTREGYPYRTRGCSLRSQRGMVTASVAGVVGVVGVVVSQHLNFISVERDESILTDVLCSVCLQLFHTPVFFSHIAILHHSSYTVPV
jgi:hypothetical protein